MFNPEIPPTPPVEKKSFELSDSAKRELSTLEGEIGSFETDQVRLLKDNGMERGIDEFIKTGSLKTDFLQASGFSVDIDSINTNLKLSEEGLKEMAKEMRERIEEAKNGGEKYSEEKVTNLIRKFRKIMADAIEQIKEAAEKKKKKDLAAAAETTI
jgi:hypothetical protein